MSYFKIALFSKQNCLPHRGLASIDKFLDFEFVNFF